MSQPAVVALLIVFIALVTGALSFFNMGRQTDRRERPTPGKDTGANKTKNNADRTAPDLNAISNWAYQLQDFDPERAARAPFDLLVIDPTLEGDDDSALSPATLERLKRKPDGSRRIVLAYLSIGEAESYRSYWHRSWNGKKPGWLLGENPDWEDNYAVRFWQDGWQKIIFGTAQACLDKIIAQGFDGVYLDKCDVYEDLERRYRAVAKSRKDLPGDMIDFITALSAHARHLKPGFHIVMQNAEGLLDHARLRQILSAVAKEELMFGQDGGEKRNQDDDYQYARHQLDLARKDGLPVLVVEYLNNGAKIAEAVQTANTLGYVLAIANPNRELADLGAPPPAAPAAPVA